MKKGVGFGVRFGVGTGSGSGIRICTKMSRIPITGLFFARFFAVLFRGCVFQGPQLPRPTADVLPERLGRVPRDRSEERGLPSLPTG